MIKEIIVFTVDNEVVGESRVDMTDEQIDVYRWFLTFKHNVPFSKVVHTKVKRDYSDVDVTEDGLMNVFDTQGTIIQGVGYSIVEGSDEYLDAIVNNSLEDYLVFI